MNKIILGIALVSISFWSCHKSSQKLQEKICSSSFYDKSPEVCRGEY